MKDLKVPGVVWAIGIIVAIALIHANEVAIQQTTGLDAYMLDIIVGVLIAILKGLSLGTAELNQALDIIDRLLADRRTPPPTEGMRSADLAPKHIVVEQVPERPDPIKRWLFG